MNPAAVTFRCHCGQPMKARAEHAGRKTACPKCKAILVIPATSTMPVQPSAAQPRPAQQQPPQQQRPAQQQQRPVQQRPAQQPRPGQPRPPAAQAKPPVAARPAAPAGAPIAPGATRPGVSRPAAPAASRPNIPNIAAPGAAGPQSAQRPMANRPQAPAAMQGIKAPGAAAPPPSAVDPLGDLFAPSPTGAPGQGGGDLQLQPEIPPFPGSSTPYAQGMMGSPYQQSTYQQAPFVGGQPMRYQPQQATATRRGGGGGGAMKVLTVVGGGLLTLAGVGVGVAMIAAFMSPEVRTIKVRALVLPFVMVAGGIGMIGKGMNWVSDDD